MKKPPPDLSAPDDLRAARVTREGEELAILSFRIPDTEGARALTSAERDVVAALLAGKSNGDIARERATSVRTVANQVASIFRKLGVHSRTQLVAHCALLPRS